MKIYTYYSSSHKILYDDFFKPSLRLLYSKEDAPIKGMSIPQISDTGDFGNFDFNKTVNHKYNLLKQALKDNWGDYFIFADSDIQFIKPFISDLKIRIKDYDIVAQADENDICSGFFIAKANIAVESFFNSSQQMLIDENFKYNDQVYFNRCKNMINYELLPKDKYYTVGNFFTNSQGTHVWSGEDNITIPNDVYVHHANYIIGVENKIKFMNLVKQYK